jgi:hypothetical protein
MSTENIRNEHIVANFNVLSYYQFEETDRRDSTLK